MNAEDGPSCTADDGLSFMCAICQASGSLTQCSQCSRGFHIHCLSLCLLPEQVTWVICFECKDFVMNGEESVLKCTYTGCNKSYHRYCISKWKGQFHTEGGLLCPQHVCDACGSEENTTERKLIRCVECPRAYHEGCFPEGSYFFKDNPGYMICWRHGGPAKHAQDKIKMSLSSAFRNLPLPDQYCEFELPCAYQEFVRDMKLKPQSFVQIRRNIYLIKKPKRRPQDEYMQCACGSAGGLNSTCEKDCICSMLQYSCSASCACGSSCKNLPFQKRLGKKLKLVKTERCGWGLQAAELIKAGDFLIEYVGEVIDDKTCEERLWGMKARGESNFYMCEINRETVIDASFKGNISRYINHSCRPNTELQKWQIDEELRIGVFAISDIQKGEAISYDYQFIPFGQEQDCFCGASGCRGKLGRRLSKQKVSAIMALKVVQQELFMVREPKKPKITDAEVKLQYSFLDGTAPKRLCCGTVMKGGRTCIDQYFPKQKLTFSSISKFEDKVAGTTDMTAPCIGRRVRIWWPVDEKFYSGTITEFDGYSRRHKIEYDDGQVQFLCMDNEKWELINSMIQGHQPAHATPNGCSSEESFVAKKL
ncbi:hypothetical protein KP509_08G056800 [Ceratopteris richardii]|uniref:Histone-lysine N-methyltransferase n=1 Tax=Ceratopteris richardii TaxID=49495 RepID=A0A8T2UAQ6_CERRI|nr:hypothetical protein KP509_08G056800 [Ceratopteris richardii]